MSKALQGAAILGVDAALVAGAAFTGGADFAVAFMATKLFTTIAVAGAALEAGAIASALTQNRAMGITIRQPAASRNFVYGSARIGGTSIFESTTGSGPAQRNYVIVLADHPCQAIVNLYLDGRQIFWDPGSDGNTTRNGINFGGNADGNDHVDEGGNKYNMGGLVFCTARYGDQLPGDVMGELTANDPRWAASAQGSPYVGGCTYVYLKIEADASMFPSDPEIRFTIQGKNDIWDPRTGTTGYSENWALCVADVLQNVEYGVGESLANINTAQLIAAANVCDEQVFSATAGMNESRYTVNGQWDTGASPENILDSMMPAAQGRLSYIGGEWFVFPAYYPGPSFTFNEGDILNTSIAWTGARKIRERYNRVRGTFIAPRFPFAVAGNLYDSNGFGPDGTRANLFGLEWMPESFPDYAQDAFHGYAVDPWLTADQGIERVMNLDFKCTISLATAQRLAKIALLRNRLGAGSTTLTLSLAAFQAIPCDVIQVNYAPLGWTNKLLEIIGVTPRVDYPDEGPPRIVIDLAVQETSPEIYEWQPAPISGSTIEDELTINDLPTVPFTPASIYSVAAPSNVVVTDASASLALGVHQPLLSVTWTAAPDAFVSQYQIQYQKVGSPATSWLSAASVDGSTTMAFVAPVSSGTTYNVRVRTLRSSGATSAWVTGTGSTS